MNAARLRINLPQSDFWIDVIEEESGKFVVVDDNMTVKNGDWICDAVTLGFSGWDEEVVDIDNGASDEARCFGMSSYLRWYDVDLTTSPGVFYAPSFKRLIEAFHHVAVCAWYPGEI